MDLKERITQDLAALWFIIGHTMGSRPGRRDDQGIRGLDPTRGKGRIIAMLKIKDGLSTKDLAQVLGIRVSSLNETLAKMEKTGLVTRQPSEADKRVMLVYLTDAGAQAPVEEPGETDLLAGFSPEELEQLSEYLSRMLDNAEQSLDEGFRDRLNAHWEAQARFMNGDIGSGRRQHPPFPFPGAGGPFPFGPRCDGGR